MKTIYIFTATLIALIYSTSATYAQGLASPFQLVSFTAQQTENTATIQWSTKVETNTHYFIIDRTTDGVSYTTIDSVRGAGNSDFQHDYQVIDNTPVQGVAYYRLTEVSEDGIVTRYSMTALTWNPETTTIHACYERERIHIHVSAEDGDTYSVLVVNRSGKVLIQQNYTVSKGENDICLYPNFSDGMYIVNVVSTTNNNINFSKKLLIGNCSFRG